MYPLKFKPILKEHIWGGQRLLEIKKGQIGRISASKSYGESWDISTLPRNISMITNGFLKGNSLLEAVEVYMGDLVGESVFEKYGEAFPLLLKTLTCRDRISVQVHPDDALAMERHDSCGKTELWYVVSSSPDAGGQRDLPGIGLCSSERYRRKTHYIQGCPRRGSLA